MSESYFYVSTLHKATSVSHAVTCNFTSEDSTNVIIALDFNFNIVNTNSKRTHIEIYEFDRDTGLIPLQDVDIFGRIASIDVYRPDGRTTDILLVTTEAYQCISLSYNSSKERLQTDFYLEFKDRPGRICDLGQLSVLDPFHRAIGMHVYQGLMKIIPISNNPIEAKKLNDEKLRVNKRIKNSQGGEFGKPFDLRFYDELEIQSIVFLYNESQVQLAVLYRDARQTMHVRVHHVDMSHENFGDKPIQQEVVHETAHKLVAVPNDIGGGFLVLAETVIQYYALNQDPIEVRIPVTVFSCYCLLASNGSRILLGDCVGNLFMLVLCLSEGKVVEYMTLEKLGQTSIATCLTHLKNEFVFVGSHYGNSQLISLAHDASCDEQFIEIVETYTNLGPIVDMNVVDIDQNSQSHLVTCSGAFQNGSLKIIKNGVGITHVAGLEMDGIKGVWPIRSTPTQVHDNLLVLSFTAESRLLSCDKASIEEYEENTGFSLDKETICVKNILDGLILQITSASVRLLLGSHDDYRMIDEWTPESGFYITNASIDAFNQSIVSLNNGLLLTFLIENSKIKSSKTRQFSHEISSVSVDQLSTDKASQYCTIGFWTNVCVQVLKLSDLSHVLTSRLDTEVVPRSTLLTRINDMPYLFVCLADGRLIVSQWVDSTASLDSAITAIDSNDPDGGHLSTSTTQCDTVHPEYSLKSEKVLNIGTRCLGLGKIEFGNTQYLFAASDSPVVFYVKDGHLSYANVTAKEITFATPCKLEIVAQAMLYIENQHLKIGTVDDIQKLRISSISLGESPRRIIHQLSTRSFGLITMKTQQKEGKLVESCSLHILNDTTFDVSCSFRFKAYESAEAICNLSDGAGTEYFVVGTVMLLPDQMEAEESRILIFQLIESTTLRLVSDNTVSGGLYSLSIISTRSPQPTLTVNRIVCGIGSRVELFKWNHEQKNSLLESLCVHYGHIISLKVETQGDFVLVGDLKQSATLLQYTRTDDATGTKEQLVEIAKDESSNWITSLNCLNDESFLLGDSSFNIFSLMRNCDAAEDQDRRRLLVSGCYHIGQQVNCIRTGSLMPKQQQLDDLDEHKHLLYGTVDGAIGLAITLSEPEFHALNRIQENLRKLIPVVGHLKHSDWRAFKNDYTRKESFNFIDGDFVDLFMNMDNEEQSSVMRSCNKTNQEQHLSKEEVYAIIQKIRKFS